MNETLPPCPECSSEYTYGMGALLVCPECAHEWSPAADSEEEPAGATIKDAVGNILADGDTVTVVKDLKVKGSSAADQGRHEGPRHPPRQRRRRP